MRKLLLCLAVFAALAVPAVAAAKDSPPDMICGTACDGGGGGWTGCTTATGDDSGGVWGIAGWHHYLDVYYCKVNGLITYALSEKTTRPIRSSRRRATKFLIALFTASSRVLPGGRAAAGRPLIAAV